MCLGGANVPLYTFALREAEIVALRHQLNVLRRKSPKRLAFSNFDRLIFASLYRISPRIVNALVIVKPETVIRWHRAGFRLFWRWKSRSRGGRPCGVLPGSTASSSSSGLAATAWGWHSDNEAGLGNRPTIASLSLGRERRALASERHWYGAIA